MKLLQFLCLGLLSMFIACQQNTDLTLARNKASDYRISHEANADEKVAKAAQELQNYLRQITEVEMPVEVENTQDSTRKLISIGLLPEPASEAEIRIKTEGDRVWIQGGSPQSTLYAVYTFLEEYTGCRFYTPEAELVPNQPVLTLKKGLDYRYIPEITTRTVHSRLYYQDHSFADKRKVTYEAFPFYVPGAGVHTFHRFMPSAVFYKDHPEYYALRNGKRIPTQLCLSNEDVFQIVKDSVAAYLGRHPDAQVISVSQDDNQQYCQCEHCQAVDLREGSPSGSMIEFVNKIAASFPNKMISTLAYQYTRKAPRQLKPRENVLITLCSIECDRSGPISEKCQDFTEDLIAWGKITDKVRIWDYTTQFTNFLAPFPNLHTLQPNVQLFRDNQAKWVFEQHSHHPSELFELRSYLTAKLLWNPDLDQEALVNDFLNGYYEEAGPYVKKYIDQVHTSLKEHPDFFLFLYGDPSQAFDAYLNADLLLQYDQWFDTAEEAVINQPEVLQRVKAARLSVDYAILEASRKNLSKSFSLTEQNENGEWSEPLRLRERLERFRKTCQEQDIVLMNEMGYTVQEYLEFYDRTLKRAQQPNLLRGKPVKLLQKPKKYANEDPQTLTDGALGGANFYANWLGFEGNDLEAVIDLGEETEVREVSSAFLQVVNHIVFLPQRVTYSYSLDGNHYQSLGTVSNPEPLSAKSKINDIQYFTLEVSPVKVRYLKVVADNMDTAPHWHHGAGMPSWIFVDEVMAR
ncbi:DUF4838 domain-containing protein [Rapidithrix thailandica]|uniref:DUF4838 domain-containing protein n=1 Tax=Rapidithrix thailandica TaxID=413964 RepID=A0AAW9RP61_9BACT